MTKRRYRHLAKLLDEMFDKDITLAACGSAADAIRDLEDDIQRLRAALTEIAKGEGRYSRNPLTHAENTIVDMRSLATAALEGGE